MGGANEEGGKDRAGREGEEVRNDSGEGRVLVQ